MTDTVQLPRCTPVVQLFSARLVERGFAPLTAKSYGRWAECFSKWLATHTNATLAEAGPLHRAQYLDDLRARGWSETAVRSRMSALREFARFAGWSLSA